uniref:Uncharacterized protein n=1 Tax=Chenopodium quinoa TaxID=63459 RepID=A0A803KWL8_CHEQI
MDSQQNRKGFIKGKLFSFTRASKSSQNVHYSNNRMRPNLSSASVPSITYLVDHQDFNSQPRQKVSLFVPEYTYKSVNEFESYFSTVDDENVNMKAASYISSVRERFKLERINSERNSSLELI